MSDLGNMVPRIRPVRIRTALFLIMVSLASLGASVYYWWSVYSLEDKLAAFAVCNLSLGCYGVALSPYMGAIGITIIAIISLIITYSTLKQLINEIDNTVEKRRNKNK